MLYAKIIATIGPASLDKELLLKMYAKGMRVARLNLSHGDYTWTKNAIALIRECNETLPTPIGIMLDTKGPEIRTEDRNEPLEVTEGMVLGFVHEPRKKQSTLRGTLIGVDYKDIARDLKRGDIMMIDGGKLRVRVSRVERGIVIGKALDTTVITGRRHVNLPGIPVRLPTLSQEDKKDIGLAVREQVDYVALSFIRHKKDVQQVRTMIQKLKGHVRIIAKIETQDAIDNLDGICESADGVMIARGDLGVEAGLEKIPLLQEMIMTTASNHKKPCIMATEMLESMRHNPTPTRAELSDVGDACYNMVDGMMLSGETSTGAYPLECVTMMHDIAAIIETYNKKSYQGPTESDLDDMLSGVIALSRAVKADSILVLSNVLEVAHMLSWARPYIPMYVLSKEKRLPGLLSVVYGVEGYTVDTGKTEEEREKMIKDFLKKIDPNGTFKRVVVYADHTIPYNTERSIELMTF